MVEEPEASVPLRQYYHDIYIQRGAAKDALDQRVRFRLSKLLGHESAEQTLLSDFLEAEMGIPVPRWNGPNWKDFLENLSHLDMLRLLTAAAQRGCRLADDRSARRIDIVPSSVESTRDRSARVRPRQSPIGSLG